MPARIATVTFVVDDYDRAIAWFTGALGFQLLEDTPLGGGKRWVRVAPAGGEGAALLLAQAVGAEQAAAIGRQAGGRVAFFLETSTIAADYARMAGAGVQFREGPRQEAYGTVAVFTDPWGNAWDLIGPAASGATSSG